MSFAKDEAFFNNMLAAFYTTPRKAYINEVYAVMGLPIFTEGSAVVESGTGKSCVRSREIIEGAFWEAKKEKSRSEHRMLVSGVGIANATK